jgi:hypothetical protein
MEPDFAALSGQERVARCLALAQAELDRANACRDAVTRDLHLSLAECWRSMAKQFESLSSLNVELKTKDRDLRATRPRQEFDLPLQLKRFAT